MRTSLPRLGRVAAAVALVAIPLAACGGDDDDAGTTDTTAAGGADGTVTVDAKDALKFDPDDLTATAGEIHFELVGDGSLPHTFVIEDHESDLKLSVTGDSDDGTITLEAGTYTFYCDVAGHRAAGMEGTLTVE